MLTALLSVAVLLGTVTGQRLVNQAAALGVTWQHTIPNSNTRLFQQAGAYPGVPGLRDLAFVGYLGIPSVSIIDYDNDGDDDLIYGNPFNVNNTLFRNNLIPNGTFSFTDVTNNSIGLENRFASILEIGVADLDNDGDDDVAMLTSDGAFRMNIFENVGGRFVDRTGNSGTLFQAAPSNFGIGIAMADFNGDGLVDIILPGFLENNTVATRMGGPHCCNPPAHLYTNQGGFRFADTSAAAGINVFRDTPASLNPGVPSAVGSTVYGHNGVTAVDYDYDGDTDIIFLGNQGPFPVSVGRVGFLHVFQNQGTGTFVEVALGGGNNDTFLGVWMGANFGDFNCDGNLDMFTTNSGGLVGAGNSRHFLGTGNPNSPFMTPNTTQYFNDPFGWASVTMDYDNDGDQDILYIGGIDIITSLLVQNPGVFLENTGNCTGEFVYNPNVVGNYTRRITWGGVVSDLNQDGFPDFVSTTSVIVPPTTPLTIVPTTPFQTSVLPISTVTPFTTQTTSFPVSPAVNTVVPGTAIVDVNTRNSNRWVRVSLVGGAGIIGTSRVNRNGIGAVMQFRPFGGQAVLSTVEGSGSSFGGNSYNFTFGLGSVGAGILQILWPGRALSPLFVVNASTSVVIPEIPCSTAVNDATAYDLMCVQLALQTYQAQGIITQPFADFLLASYTASTNVPATVPAAPSTFTPVTTGSMAATPLTGATNPVVGASSLGAFAIQSGTNAGQIVIAELTSCSFVDFGTGVTTCILPASAILATLTA